MKSKPIHPILFALYPIIYLYSHNIGEVPMRELFYPIIIALTISLSIQIVLNKKTPRYSIITSLLILTFFYFWLFFDSLSAHFYFIYELRIRYKLLFIFSSLGVLFYLIIRNKKLDQLTPVLNYFALFLFVLPVFRMGTYFINTRIINFKLDNKSQLINQVPVNKFKPDIYYLMLDGYPNLKVLKNTLHYQNDNLNNFLSTKGFKVCQNSKSNYPITFLSLSSILNMEYVNNLAIKANDELDRTPFDYGISNGKVQNILKSKGYQFINISSGWGATDILESADINYKYSILNEFSNSILQSSILKSVVYNFDKENIEYSFRRLKTLTYKRGPKFVLAHFMCPHDEHFYYKGNVNASKIDKYLSSLTILNQKLIATIDYIIKHAPSQPIIIIQSDHGTCINFKEECLRNATDANIQERLKNFTAFYFPNKNYQLISDSMSAVNTFNILFNSNFNAHLKLQSDSFYFSNYDLPYHFKDVTKLMKSNN